MTFSEKLAVMKAAELYASRCVSVYKAKAKAKRLGDTVSKIDKGRINARKKLIDLLDEIGGFTPAQ
jgi:hypothetical protein